MTENVSSAKLAIYTRTLLAAKTRDDFRQRKLAAFHQPPEFRTSFAHHHSDYHIDRLQRSPNIMVDADYVKVSAQEVIIRFRALMASVAPPLQCGVAQMMGNKH
jgi:hypothetical protein